jgi:preprotein translocase subunit Sec61beta
MPINEISVAPRRAVKIGLIIAMILFVASLVMRTIDIYETHQSISPTAIASLALGALGVVMAAGAFFYAVLRKK